MTKITTIEQLNSLNGDTMMYAAIICTIALILACLFSIIIPYQGGSDNSYKKRRIGFIVIGVVSTIAFYLYNDLVVKDSIMNDGFKSMFSETNIKCVGMILGGYIVIGIILMLMFRNSKFGSILGKIKE